MVPGLVFGLAGPLLIDLMTWADEVRHAARIFLPWAALAPVIGIAASMLDSVFIGATQTRDMRSAMVLSVGVYLCALSLLVPWLGNHGLWVALVMLNVTRAVTLARFYSGLEARLR